MGASGRVAVIAGGLSHERDISIRSGRRLLRELQQAGLEAGLYDADESLLTRLAADRVEVAFPTLHGDIGEDGALMTVLELVGLPYVGSSSRACRLAWDKATARVLVERAGMPVPHWAALPVTSFREFGSSALVSSLVTKLGLPLVVKPSQGGSVLGISGVDGVEELPGALVHTFAYGAVALVESYVQGTDVAVAVIERDGEPEAMPPVALHYERGDKFDFAARYSPDLITIDAPAVLKPETVAELERLALLAHTTLGLRDLSRSDFLVDEAGAIVHLETAVTPGLTETSLFPFALQAGGTSLGASVGLLLSAALARGN